MTDSAHFTDLRSLLGALAASMDLIDANLERHHERTAYLAYLIAEEMGLEAELAYQCVYASLLHDVGAILSDELPDVREIEREARQIASLGAGMLRDLPGMEQIAGVIEYSQCSWQSATRCRRDADESCQRLMTCSGIIYLADRVAVMLDPKAPVLTQARNLRRIVASCRGTVFCPEAADAFLRLSEREFVWLDALLNPRFLLIFTGEITSLSLERAVALTKIMSRIIDFRSPFTAMHSAGVAASASALAELAGMSREERLMMEIAGDLHDVGKLKVPRRILEKPGPLDQDEMDIMREHPYYTRLILMSVKGFEQIANWAGFHHEKLDGSGYPFHFGGEDLDTGARILAISDIFSAITEDRPYRAGMTKEESIRILRSHGENGGLDPALVGLLCDHYEEIDRRRALASKAASERYTAFGGVRAETAETAEWREGKRCVFRTRGV